MASSGVWSCADFLGPSDGTSDTKVGAVWSFGIPKKTAALQFSYLWLVKKLSFCQWQGVAGQERGGWCWVWMLSWLCCFDSTKNAYGFLFPCLLLGCFYRKILMDWIFNVPCEVFDVLLAGTWYLRPSILVEGMTLTNGKFVKSRIFDLSGTFVSRLLWKNWRRFSSSDLVHCHSSQHWIQKRWDFFVSLLLWQALKSANKARELYQKAQYRRFPRATCGKNGRTNGRKQWYAEQKTEKPRNGQID